VRWQYAGDQSPNEWRIVSTNGKLIATGLIDSWITQEGVLQGWMHGPAQLGPGSYLLEWLESGEHVGSTPWIWSPQ